MTGLNPCQDFYPWGYNNPLEPPAQKISAAPLAPNEYNRNAIRGPSRARRIVPVPVAGPMHPPLRGQDFYGDKNAAGLLPWPQNPKSFNVNAIGTNYKTTYPILTPWSREAAKSQVVDSMNVGSIEPPKDLRTVAETFAKTSSDEKEREWWERRVNALSQLEAITITRGLNPQEQQLKNEIFKEISDRSANTSTITASLAAVHIPKSAPATSAEISALLAAMIPAAPIPAAAISTAPASTTSTATISITSTAPASTTSTASTSSAVPGAAHPSGGEIHIRNPPDYGPPQGPDIIDYTGVPRLEWKSPAVQGFAHYISSPNHDRQYAIKYLRAHYKDTPNSPAKIPNDEWDIWKIALDVGLPGGKRRKNESDIDFLARMDKDSLYVFWAYLSRKEWFDIYMSNMKLNIPDLILNSAQLKFPKHPGMLLSTLDLALEEKVPSEIAKSTFSILSEPTESPLSRPSSPPGFATRIKIALTPQKSSTRRAKSQGP